MRVTVPIVLSVCSSAPPVVPPPLPVSTMAVGLTITGIALGEEDKNSTGAVVSVVVALADGRQFTIGSLRRPFVCSARVFVTLSYYQIRSIRVVIHPDSPATKEGAKCTVLLFGVQEMHLRRHQVEILQSMH